MVIALFDRSIGRENSLNLWRKLGKPATVFLPLGHYTAILALPYLQFKAVAFFTAQFAAASNRLVAAEPPATGRTAIP